MNLCLSDQNVLEESKKFTYLCTRMGNAFDIAAATSIIHYDITVGEEFVPGGKFSWVRAFILVWNDKDAEKTNSVIKQPDCPNSDYENDDVWITSRHCRFKGLSRRCTGAHKFSKSLGATSKFQAPGGWR